METIAEGPEMPSGAPDDVIRPSDLEGPGPISLETIWLERIQTSMGTPQVCPNAILPHENPAGPAPSQESFDACKDEELGNKPELPRNLATASFPENMGIGGATGPMDNPQVCPGAVLPLECPKSSSPSEESNDSCKDAFSANGPDWPQNLPKLPFSAENSQEIVAPRKDEGFWGQKWVERHKKSLREAFLGRKPPNMTKMMEEKKAPPMGDISVKVSQFASTLVPNLGEKTPLLAETAILVESGRQVPNLLVGPHIGQEIPREPQHMLFWGQKKGQNPPSTQNMSKLGHQMGQNPQESTSTSSLGPPVVEFAQREISQGATHGDPPPGFSPKCPKLPPWRGPFGVKLMSNHKKTHWIYFWHQKSCKGPPGKWNWTQLCRTRPPPGQIWTQNLPNLHKCP